MRGNFSATFIHDVLHYCEPQADTCGVHLSSALELSKLAEQAGNVRACNAYSSVFNLDVKTLSGIVICGFDDNLTAICEFEGVLDEVD